MTTVNENHQPKSNTTTRLEKAAASALMATNERINIISSATNIFTFAKDCWKQYSSNVESDMSRIPPDVDQGGYGCTPMPYAHVPISCGQTAYRYIKNFVQNSPVVNGVKSFITNEIVKPSKEEIKPLF